LGGGLPAIFHPDRWLPWLGVPFVPIVYFFPAALWEVWGEGEEMVGQPSKHGRADGALLTVLYPMSLNREGHHRVREV
jgi:hypothetical protein